MRFGSLLTTLVALSIGLGVAGTNVAVAQQNPVKQVITPAQTAAPAETKPVMVPLQKMPESALAYELRMQRRASALDVGNLLAHRLDRQADGGDACRGPAGGRQAGPAGGSGPAAGRWVA